MIRDEPVSSVVVVVVVVSLPGPVVFANAYGLTARLKSDDGIRIGKKKKKKKTRMRRKEE